MAIAFTLPKYSTSAKVSPSQFSGNNKWRGALFMNSFATSKPSRRRMSCFVRSSVDDSGLDPSTNSSTGRTRLLRIIQAFQKKLSSRIVQIRKNLPMKLLFFLVGFYCATAFATVIGQTGDWDILSAALAVFIVEGIGALMYGGAISTYTQCLPPPPLHRVIIKMLCGTRVRVATLYKSKAFHNLQLAAVYMFLIAQACY
ncbi:hypothetical protein ACFE04_018434 [Oxalis oulophora]